ncbi:MAG: MFS transporter [Chloroflexota bacterium]|nr:MAG: MFS transporter [Chloroflexota bacterium]
MSHSPPTTQSASDHDGQPGWRRDFTVLWFAQFCAITGFSLALPFLPLYARTLGVESPTEAALWAGAMSSTGGLLMAFMAPVWGVMADRYGRKPMVTRSMLGAGVFIVGMAFVNDVRQLFALRAVQGIFSGTVPAARLLAASVVPSSRLGQSMGLMATAQFMANSFGPFIGGLLVEQFGYGPSFIVTGALLLFSASVVFFFVREKFTPTTTGGSRGRFVFDPRALLGTPRLAAILLVMLAVNMAQFSIGPILPLYVETIAGPDEPVARTVGLILGAAAISSAVAASVGGRLGDRIGHRRVLLYASLAAGILYLPQAMAQSPLQLLIARAASGAFVGAIIPVGMARVALITPIDRRGYVFGLTTTVTTLGNAAGPMLGAGIAAQFGFRASFVFMAVAVVASALWAMRTDRADDATG